MKAKMERYSAAQAREIGDVLKKARLAANLPAAELANRMGCAGSTISRMESGSRGISERDVTMYLTICGVPRTDVMRLLELVGGTDEGYHLRLHRKQVAALGSLRVQEQLASAITIFDSALVPGLLQTREYALAVFHAAGVVPPEDIEGCVRARLARQSLLHRPNPPQLDFFVPEQAVRTVLGGPRVMHEQVVRMLVASSSERCRIRVVPESACPAGVLGGSFWLLRHEGQRPLVYSGSQTASLFVDEEEGVAMHRRILARLTEVALNRAESRSWLSDLASEYDRAPEPPSACPQGHPRGI